MLEKFDDESSKQVLNIFARDESQIYNYDPEKEKQQTTSFENVEIIPTKILRATDKRMIAGFFRTR